MSMFRKSNRIIQILLGTAVLAVLAFVVAGRPGERPVQIEAARAVRKDLTLSITGNGKVEPIEPRVLQAQLTTFVEKVIAREGQQVSRGALLLTLDTMDLQSDLVHLKEQLVGAEDERQQAANGGSPDERVQLNADLA